MILLLAAAGPAAQNPIVPAGVYFADPSARVWSDGRLYLYGSVDESTRHYCSRRYHILRTADLKGWEVLRDRFASSGPGDQVAGSDGLLFAPDCQFRGGRYYLYYCLPDPRYREGVAVAKSPAGPFVEGRRIDLQGRDGIDPCVFLDEDGQAYYLWGQFRACIARLEPNMVEIDPATIQEGIVTEKEHFFHEGAHLVKRKGLYYLVYAHMGRADRPTCIGYATAPSPMGPYEYGGVIIDNDHCDPGNWNNHGSIVKFKGRWYVFYHRATHGSRTMRKACLEPITFNPDGSIDEVEMTSQGAGGPLDARERIEAERACLLFGHARIEAFAPAAEQLGRARDGDQAAYKYLDFGAGVGRVRLRIRMRGGTGSLELVPDRPWKRALCRVKLPGGKGTGQWQVVEAKLPRTAGVHALWLRFRGGEGDLCDLDWLQFAK